MNKARITSTTLVGADVVGSLFKSDFKNSERIMVERCINSFFYDLYIERIRHFEPS